MSDTLGDFVDEVRTQINSESSRIDKLERELAASQAEQAKWQALAEGLAEALNHCGHAAYCESVMWFPGKCTCGKADALAAYESAKKGEHP